MSDTPTRTLHDRLFKEFLHRFLPDFLHLFFPDEAARLNFDTLTFLDQELIVNLPDQTLRITDVVAEVVTQTGTEEVIIVHLEVEGRDKRTIPARMFEYYSLLRLLRQKRVLPLALVLKPRAGGLSWPTYSESLFGHKLVTFQYGQVGLRDLTSEDYLTESPIAATLASLMKPAHLHPAEVKLTSLRRVIDSHLTDGDKLFLIDIIETYLPQAELANAGDEIMQALDETERTWAEKLESKGKTEGRLEVLHHQLTVKFGELPADFVQRLQAITDTAVLDQLSEQILTAVSLHDITLPDNDNE